MADEPYLSEIARRAASDFGDRPAFVTADGWPMSFADLDLAADEIAHGLVEVGIRAGSTIALVLPSGVDYVTTYIAACRLGAVVAGINPRLTSIEITGCLEVLDADLIVANPSIFEGDTDDDTPVLSMTPSHAPTSVGGILRGGGRPSVVDADDDRPVCICFSSGSTGAPKGAWFTDRQLKAVAEVDSGGAWGQGGNGIASTQLAHVGFMTKLPWLLASGQTTHLLQRWSAGPVLELIAKHEMAAVNGVAPQIALMVDHPLAGALDFSCVKAIVAGGAASSPELVGRACATFDAPYSIRYSSTESGGIGLASSIDATNNEALHSVGRPRPGVSAEIRAADLSVNPPGVVGELWLNSPTVMSGYWRDDAATDLALVNGWLHTGDLASMDDAGLIRLAGRVKEMYIRGGYNVYPVEVETVLAGHPDVREIAVVPRSDRVMGEVGLAVIVPQKRAPSLESLRDFASHQLASYKLPEAIAIVDQLPRNSSDKVDKLQLIAQHG